ncbi:OLC1v1025868C1 [Oldenlandia corymbosa var. corymbosa]|uniref:OLC1v1025868C1 n=1 Tax=Oldenlandia corymbosa var. corymbosa TaxID=529605 RepID=A0AAV1C7I1_OLDCO|nr:OLC1v1025868C1 [Oldenlandia corymbosa var. corymbosa]
MELGSHNESGQPNFLQETRSLAPRQSTGEGQILRKRKEAELLHHPKREPSCREEYEAQIACRAHKQKFVAVTKRRLQFEEQISEDPSNKSAYVEYAKWQEEYTKWPVGVNVLAARGTWQKALYVPRHRQDPEMWKEYAHFEMRNGFITEARDIWFSAIRVLPQVDELWKEHIRMEEMLGNFETVGIIFELWMKQHPSQRGWVSYIEFELKYNGVESARGIFERFVEWSPKNCYAWIKYAALERSSGEIERARSIFERAFDQPTLDRPDLLYKAFTDFAKASLGDVGDVDQLLKKLRIKKKEEDGVCLG